MLAFLLSANRLCAFVRFLLSQRNFLHEEINFFALLLLMILFTFHVRFDQIIHYSLPASILCSLFSRLLFFIFYLHTFNLLLLDVAQLDQHKAQHIAYRKSWTVKAIKFWAFLGKAPSFASSSPQTPSIWYCSEIDALCLPLKLANFFSWANSLTFIEI